MPVFDIKYRLEGMCWKTPHGGLMIASSLWHNLDNIHWWLDALCLKQSSDWYHDFVQVNLLSANGIGLH